MAAQTVEEARTADLAGILTPPPAAAPSSERDTRRRRFTVDEYYRMAETGILGPDERLELIEGDVVVMSPINSRHASTVTRVYRRFTLQLGERALTIAQNPARLDRYAEPQPDVMLARWRDDYYAGAHPQPDDILLVVEVADSSVALDRRVKVPMYARRGLREVWLMDLPGEAIEVYRRPAPEGYAEFRRLRRGESLAPEAFPDLAFAIEDLLG